VVAVTHDRYFWTRGRRILELDRGQGIPGRATTARGWIRSEPGCPGGKVRIGRQRTLQHELEWIRMRPGPAGQGKARITAYEKLCRATGKRPENVEISIPPGPRLAAWWLRPRISARDMATGF